MDDEQENIKPVQMEEDRKRELVLQIEETARNNAKQYRGCSQWTLYALQKHLNMMNVCTFRAASALAGGVAGSGEVCGALLGALMGVGLACGRDQMEPTETSAAFGEAMKRGAKVCDRFRNEFGSLRCRDIQQLLFGRSWDLRNPEERNDFLSRDDTDKCSDLVISRAAAIAAEVILER